MSPRSTTSAMFRKSGLLATALGFVALGSTMMPAAALPSHLASLSARVPSYSPAPSSSHHAVSSVANLKPLLVGPSTSAANHSVSEISHLPPRVMEPTNSGAGHPVSEISHLPPRIMEPTAPGAGKKVAGTLQKPTHLEEPIPAGAFDPPSNPPGGGGGNPPPAPQNPGKPSMPGGYPSGGMGPVVISAPPVVFQAPGTVITARNPVATRTTATTATTATAAATEPCNCLTKQYLDDGSVLFRDLCTKEAAIATPAELKAQTNASVAR